MSEPKLIDPRAARLMRNADFIIFRQGMLALRTRLFEDGECDEELRAIFEKRGMRKILQKLTSESGINQMFGANLT